jgi:peroxiredoxin Q/BCP
VPNVGETAPDFTARATSGTTVQLSGLRGKWVVLYFFPKAFSPGCTRETARFRDAYPELSALGAEVFGISVDDHETQCDFAARMNVRFAMIGDSSGEISRRYDVYRQFLPLRKRITYLIDPEGVVRGVFQHEFQISKHLDDVLHALERLQQKAG